MKVTVAILAISKLLRTQLKKKTTSASRLKMISVFNFSTYYFAHFLDLLFYQHYNDFGLAKSY